MLYEEPSNRYGGVNGMEVTLVGKVALLKNTEHG